MIRGTFIGRTLFEECQLKRYGPGRRPAGPQRGNGRSVMSLQPLFLADDEQFLVARLGQVRGAEGMTTTCMTIPVDASLRRVRVATGDQSDQLPASSAWRGSSRPGTSTPVREIQAHSTPTR